ncbi:DUF2335 domain-containing protein [Acinetobacter baumannii]|uniref:DUF2335 domain-containing protein n=1 Tax=Acinetobacter baumannii TaxID=470 RepID=UPI002340B9BF|nr:DUF2335 domain-containing protein [Acinetobacter baumannii]MDC4776093.1 hypothetical protein [Acinetobacter baumannii]MDV4326073.1 hypothetical protein [Acinetobacter baumannii]
MNQRVTDEELPERNYSSIHIPEPEVEIGDYPYVVHGKAEKLDGKKPISFQVSHKRIESPFLPPEYIAEYEKIEPGLGKKLIDVVVEHQKFQMEIKRAEIELTNKSFAESVKVNDANIREQDSLNDARNKEIAIKSRGQIFALIISLVFMYTAYKFAELGHTVLASACISIILGMAAILFLQKVIGHSKAEEKKQEEEKIKEPNDE